MTTTIYIQHSDGKYLETIYDCPIIPNIGDRVETPTGVFTVVGRLFGFGRTKLHNATLEVE